MIDWEQKKPQNDGHTNDNNVIFSSMSNNNNNRPQIYEQKKTYKLTFLLLTFAV